MDDARNNSERRTSFLRSLHVLGELKRLSPQAEQYFSILSSFHCAIKAYKEQQYRHKYAPRANLVDRVFLPDAAAVMNESEIINTRLPSPETTILDNASAEWLSSIPLEELNGTSSVNYTLTGENDLFMRMLWETDGYMTDYPTGMLPNVEIGLETPPQTSDRLAK